jgi:hypothetical protein
LRLLLDVFLKAEPRMDWSAATRARQQTLLLQSTKTPIFRVFYAF